MPWYYQLTSTPWSMSKLFFLIKVHSILQKTVFFIACWVLQMMPYRGTGSYLTPFRSILL